MLCVETLCTRGFDCDEETATAEDEELDHGMEWNGYFGFPRFARRLPRRFRCTRPHHINLVSVDKKVAEGSVLRTSSLAGGTSLKERDVNSCHFVELCNPTWRATSSVTARLALLGQVFTSYF